jgi:chemotaxis protein MotD
MPTPPSTDSEEGEPPTAAPVALCGAALQQAGKIAVVSTTFELNEPEDLNIVPAKLLTGKSAAKPESSPTDNAPARKSAAVTSLSQSAAAGLDADVPVAQIAAFPVSAAFVAGPADTLSTLTGADDPQAPIAAVRAMPAATEPAIQPSAIAGIFDSGMASPFAQLDATISTSSPSTAVPTSQVVTVPQAVSRAPSAAPALAPLEVPAPEQSTADSARPIAGLITSVGLLADIPGASGNRRVLASAAGAAQSYDATVASPLRTTVARPESGVGTANETAPAAAQAKAQRPILPAGDHLFNKLQDGTSHGLPNPSRPAPSELGPNLYDIPASGPAISAAMPMAAKSTPPQPPIAANTTSSPVASAEEIAAPPAIASAPESATAQKAQRAAAAEQPNTGLSPTPEPALTIQLADIPVAAAEPPQGRVAAATTSAMATSVSETSPPAHQIGSVLLSMTQSQDGMQRMTVRLNPADLGSVHVQIDRSATGTAQVTITAERPQTMLLLRQDQAELHRTLDQAGILEEGRTISFHVGTLGTSSGGTPGGSSSSGGGAGNSWTPSGPPQGMGAHADGEGGGYAAREHGGYPNARRQLQDPTPMTGEDERSSPSWPRAGLDITA